MKNLVTDARNTTVKQDKYRDNYIPTIVKLRKTKDKETIVK